MNCFLCFQNSGSLINIFDGLEEGIVVLNIPNIIEKYVYIKPNKSNPMLCDKCWITIESFYIYCLNIEEIQKGLINLQSNLGYGGHPKKELEENSIFLDLPESLCDDVESLYDNETDLLENKNNSDETSDDEKSSIDALMDASTNDKDDTVLKKPAKKRRSRGKGLRKVDPINIKISNYMTLRCDICDEISPNLSDLKGHYRIAHQAKGYALCCEKKFYKRHLLVDHIDWHLDPNRFNCKLCEKTFSIADCLRKHMRDKHQTEKQYYRCEECPKQFIRQSALKMHMAFHTPAETWKFPCESCEKIFPSRYYLKTHVAFAHTKAQTKVCYICAKDVPTNRYKTHMRTHNDNYEEEKVECEICNAKLNKSYINLHRQHHQEAKIDEFVCTICSHKSPNRRALYIHMRYTHAQKKHDCKICDKSFKRKLALRQHMATHTGSTLYSCPYCPKSFTYDSNFYLHKKTKHPKENEIEKQKHKRTNFVQHVEQNNVEKSIEEETKAVEKISDIPASTPSIENNVDLKVELFNAVDDSHSLQ